MTCDAVQLKDLLEERKAELTASYDRLCRHIANTREQVGFLVLFALLELSVANLTHCGM